MTYYKVLSETGECVNGGRGCWPLPSKNADGTWTPGDWLEIMGEIAPCTHGLHACRDAQVVGWPGPTLYEMEYDGEPIDAGDKVVGRRARLLRQYERWNARTARLFACDCAERVLPIFERNYPGDKRPRRAIEVARHYARGEATREELAAAWDAARDAVSHAAWDAAWAAARAAAWAAAWDAAWDAARDAAWAAAWDAAWDAARDAAWDAERAWQYARLCQYLNGEA